MRMLGYHWIFQLSRKDPIRTCIRARPALVASSHYMEVQHELESGMGSQPPLNTCIATCTLQPGQEIIWRYTPTMYKFHKYSCIGAQIQLHWCTNTIELVHKYNSIGAQIQLHWCKYASAHIGEPAHLLLLARGKPKLNFCTSEASKHRGGAAAKFDSFLFVSSSAQ